MTDDICAQNRRSAIVSAAQAEFFAHGYGATTMSAIAARIGGSKTTLWTYFPSKQALFTAVVAALVARFGQSVEVPLEPDQQLDDALRDFAWNMMQIVGTPEIVDLHRLVIGESGRFPELGALFFVQGPARGKAKLATYLSTAMADGRVRPGDPDCAASQFIVLCQSGVVQDRLWGLPVGEDNAHITEDIEDAVSAWLSAWRADSLQADQGDARAATQH